MICDTFFSSRKISELGGITINTYALFTVPEGNSMFCDPADLVDLFAGNSGISRLSRDSLLINQ